MAIKVKNTSLTETKNWGGLEYPALYIKTLEETDRYRLLSDETFMSELNSGIAQILDEEIVLEIQTGLAAIRGLSAIQQSGSNVLPSSIATNFEGNVTVSAVIDGVATVTIGAGSNNDNLYGTLFSQVFTSSGGSANKWLGSSEKDLKGNETPALIPFDCELVCLSFSNKVKVGSSGHQLQIYKSQYNSGTTKQNVLNININNYRTLRTTNFTPVSFSAGDKLLVYITKNVGNEAQDPLITLWFKVTSFNNGTQTENFTANF